MANDWSLATMESCTGGYLVNSITEGPDSSRYFKGGVVAYSRTVLLEHSIPEAILQQHGIVSQACATAMAQTIRERLGADFGLGLTGVPGPSESEGKPFGLAYVSIVGAAKTSTFELRVPPRRITVKRRVSNAALIELCKCLTT
jgi:PncC family amidohydrolase